MRGDQAAKDGGSVSLLVPEDLSSLDSVHTFAKAIQSMIVLMNAGVMACPYAKTKDGFEWQF